MPTTAEYAVDSERQGKKEVCRLNLNFRSHKNQLIRSSRTDIPPHLFAGLDEFNARVGADVASPAGDQYPSGERRGFLALH